MTAARWADDVDAILAGDLATAFAYLTPAGGVVLSPVTTLGLRDRDEGTVRLTTSLGFAKKLERLEREPRCALAYHAREHGFAAQAPDTMVLVQGRARFVRTPDPQELEALLPDVERFMGPQPRGRFWDYVLREYRETRIVVTVDVEHVHTWPPGADLPEPPSQKPPKNGTAPRVDVDKAAQKLRALPHQLAGWRGADGFPVVTRVSVGEASAQGIRLSARDAPLPAGGRRAALIAHRFNAKLVGLALRGHTGWLQDGVYAPHTESGFRAPANKTLLLIGNGLLAKKGVRDLRRQAA